MFLIKFSQVNFGKIHKILDQFDKLIKSYIKMFEFAGLLSPLPSPGSVKFYNHFQITFNVST